MSTVKTVDFGWISPIKRILIYFENVEASLQRVIKVKKI
jgi:hypothetical protein